MYKALVPVVLVMCGCATMPENSTVSTSSIRSLYSVAEQLSMDLVRYSDDFNEDQQLLIATPVDVKSLVNTNPIAIQLQQDLMTSFQHLGYRVTDINVSDSVKAADNGTFVLTRDWQKIAANVSVTHVLVSTMELTKAGVAINSRIIDTTDNHVASSANVLVKANQLTGYVQEASATVSSNGLLYRYNQPGMVAGQYVGDAK